ELANADAAATLALQNAEGPEPLTSAKTDFSNAQLRMSASLVTHRSLAASCFIDDWDPRAFHGTYYAMPLFDCRSGSDPKQLAADIANVDAAISWLSKGEIGAQVADPSLKL